MGIFIGLLKIIGIIIAIILLIILVIIFSKINIKVYFNNENNLKYIVKVRYIFGIVSYKIDNQNNINNIRIFGINLNKKKKNKDIKNKEDNFEDVQDVDTVENKDTDIEIDDIKNSEHTKDNIENKKEENKSIKKEKNLKKTKEKIKYIIEYPNKNQIINLALELLKKLIKAIKIKKINANIEYGLDDPFQTGKICGIISIIIPFFPKKYIKKIKIIPNFEKEIYFADFYLKCSTSLFKIIMPIIIFIMKKPIREIIFSKGE